MIDRRRWRSSMSIHPSPTHVPPFAQVVSKLRELFNEMDDELEGVTGPGRSG